MSDSDKKFADICELQRQLREQCKDSIYLESVCSRLLIVARKTYPTDNTIELSFVTPTLRFLSVKSETQEKSMGIGYEVIATARVDEFCNLYDFRSCQLGLRLMKLTNKERFELLDNVAYVLHNKSVGCDFEGWAWRVLNEENE